MLEFKVLKYFLTVIYSLMLSCLLNLSEDEHTSDGGLIQTSPKEALESLSMLEQSYFRTVVSMAGAIQDAGSVAWCSSRAVGADLHNVCDELRDIEIESGFVRASALGSIEAFGDYSSTNVRITSGLTRQISQQVLQGSMSKSPSLTDSIDIVKRWIHEGNAVFSPLSRHKICLEALANPANSIQSACAKPIEREQSSVNVAGTENSIVDEVVLPCQTERVSTPYKKNSGLKVFWQQSAGL